MKSSNAALFVEEKGMQSRDERISCEEILCFRHHIDIPAFDKPTLEGFGGQFAPELQMSPPLDLSGFLDRLSACLSLRHSPLHLAYSLTQAVGGAKVWLEPEDFNPFGSYQTSDIVGQTSFAQHIGKTEISMECAFAGTAFLRTVCARMNMKCTIYIGASDIAAQPDTVEKMKRFGATLAGVKMRNHWQMPVAPCELPPTGRFAIRWLASIRHHSRTGAVGRHPLPTITRTFQLPDRRQGSSTFRPSALVFPAGPSGAAALGMYAPSIASPALRLVAVEATPLNHGSILLSHSISTDMNFPCAGPELAHWKKTGRLETVKASSEAAVRELKILRESKGIVPGLATVHAVLETVRFATELGK
ncbi:tryptophan synthase beta subunit-like PLP-dependent enzyme [Aspergillus desertorum]